MLLLYLITHPPPSTLIYFLTLSISPRIYFSVFIFLLCYYFFFVIFLFSFQSFSQYFLFFFHSTRFHLFISPYSLFLATNPQSLVFIYLLLQKFHYFRIISPINFTNKMAWNRPRSFTRENTHTPLTLYSTPHHLCLDRSCDPRYV